MSLLLIENASLAFGHVPLLDQASLTLEPGERAGLIGRNGAGKSSLLKAIAGLIKLDEGNIRRAPGDKLAYVAQEPQLNPEDTVFAAVAAGLGDLQDILAQYHQTILLAQEGDEAHLTTLAELQHELESRDGWRLNALVETTLSHLDLNADMTVAELSGGWKKRVALAQALVSEPDILLLDEPTNHLDIEAIEWLENLLKNFSGSVLFITHDRRFLDNIATRIVELDRGLLTSFPGNFTRYQAQKAEMLEQEATVNRKFDKFLAQEEVWIRKGIQARRTRNEGRVRRLEALRRERSQRRERMSNVNFNVDTGERSGKLVAELVGVQHAFGDKVIIQDFTTRIMRGDKIGLIGPNGIGKSTLLKLILGELTPDQGTIELGSKLAVAYFDQFREQLDEEATVVDVISQGNEFIDIHGTKKHVISYLEDFLFAPQRARSPVKSLSGGERNRLLLARLFTRPANVLILDEPTNDLDIDTLELLEQLLIDYTGTVFLVSHDRAFLDQVVTQVIAFEGEGKLYENAGGYEDWLIAKARLSAAASVPSTKSTPATPPPIKSKNAQKLGFNEKRELHNLPGDIAALEEEQAVLTQHLLDPNCFRDHPQEAIAWQKRIEEIDILLVEKLERWEALEDQQR
jgi:ATP-binding cassette subfamily F protein uup